MQNPYYRSAPEKKSNKSTLIIAISIIVAIVVVICVFIGVAANTFNSFSNSLSTASSTSSTDNTFFGPMEPYIAKVSVKGTISGTSDRFSSSDKSYHHAWTLATIDTLIKDGNNVALYLDVDTPGGNVYESDELYFKIKEYKEETGRPVYVYMNSMAASGGYYISAPADLIYANRNTWTGSIGVIIGSLFDVSGFMEKHGIKAEDITSGPNKGMGSYFEPLTDEQRAIYQGLVDEAYEQFVAIVAEGRGMDIETAKQIADGRIYTATQAKENGLIDEVSQKDDAEQAFRDLNLDAIIYNAHFSPAYSFANSLFGMINDAGLMGKFGQSQDIAAVLEMIETENNQPPILYMYRP